MIMASEAVHTNEKVAMAVEENISDHPALGHWTEKIKTEPSEENSGPKDANAKFTFSEKPSIEKLRSIQAAFIRERNWDQFHAPRNVLLAMVGEVGELAEIFQWKGEVKEGLPGWNDEERKHLGQELSDVFLYLIDLADRCHVDLPTAVLDKIEHNAKKYPVDKVRGSSKNNFSLCKKTTVKVKSPSVHLDMDCSNLYEDIGRGSKDATAEISWMSSSPDCATEQLLTSDNKMYLECDDGEIVILTTSAFSQQTSECQVSEDSNKAQHIPSAHSATSGETCSQANKHVSIVKKESLDISNLPQSTTEAGSTLQSESAPSTSLNTPRAKKSKKTDAKVKEPPGKVTCPICDLVLSSKHAWKRHNKKHTQSMENCPQCTRSFYDKYDLKRHIRTRHQGDPFKCSECAKEFVSRVGWKRHQEVHKESLRYTCEACGMRFSYLHNFKEHVEGHDGVKHNCSKCNASYKRRRDKLFHEKMCGVAANIICELCGKEFKCERYLKHHLKAAHNPQKTNTESVDPREEYIPNTYEEPIADLFAEVDL